MILVSVIASADLAGAEVHVEHIVRSVAATHHVIALADGPMIERWRNAGATVHRLAAPGKLPWAAVGRLAALVSRIEPTVVHTHTPKANLLATLACARLPETDRPPRIMTIHGSHRQFASARWIPASFYTLADLAAARRAAMVIAVCEADRRELVAAGFSSERLVTIVNGIPDPGDPMPARETATTGRRKNVLWAGRVSPEKRPDVMIETARLLDGHPGLGTVSMIGRGASLLRLPSRVHGEEPRESLTGAWSSTDLLVNTSASEGMSLAILEALAHGIPIVASAVGGNPEAVGNAGILVHTAGRSDHEVAALFAAAVKRFLEDAGAYRAAADAARPRYDSLFRVETMAARLRDLCERVSRT